MAREGLMDDYGYEYEACSGDCLNCTAKCEDAGDYVDNYEPIEIYGSEEYMKGGY